MFKNILGNLSRKRFQAVFKKLSEKRFCRMFEKIKGNFPDVFGEYYKRFQGILLKISGNYLFRDSGNCSRGFQGMQISIFFKKFFWFLSKIATNYFKTMEEKELLSNSSEKVFSTLLLIINLLSLKSDPHLLKKCVILASI